MASAVFYCASTEESSGSHHQIADAGDDFLQSCFLCGRALCFNGDIFMYRGDRAFCSDDCRQEQIAFDEAQERRRSALARAMKKTANSSAAKQASPGSSSAAKSTAAGAVSVA